MESIKDYIFILFNFMCVLSERVFNSPTFIIIIIDINILNLCDLTSKMIDTLFQNILYLKCFGPFLSAVRNGRSISV